MIDDDIDKISKTLYDGFYQLTIDIGKMNTNLENIDESLMMVLREMQDRDIDSRSDR